MDLTTIDAMISSEDPSRRREAAALLARAGGMDACIRLERLLLDSNSGVRDAAQNSLILVGGRPAVERMIDLLRHDEAAVRNMAIDILRQIGIDGIDLLHRAAKDEDDNVRLFVLDILGSIGSHESSRILIEGLYDSNPNVRNAAVISLGTLGDPEAFDHLKKLVNDEEWIRFSVIESLARIPHEGVVDFLLQELSRWSDEEVTVSAILEALETIRSREAVPALLDMLSRSDRYLEFSIARTLLAILSDDEIAAMQDSDRQVLKDVLDAHLPEAEEDLQIRMLGTLGRIGDSASAKGMVKLARRVDPDDEPDLWAAIQQALASLGSISTLVGLLDQDEKSAILAAGVLAEIGGEPEGREIASRIFSQDRYARRAMAEALARIGGAGLRDTILRLLQDSDGHVVGSAIRALGEMGNPEDITEISGFLRHPYPDVRDHALEAIIRIGTPKAEKCLKDLVHDSDPKIRIMGLYGLERIGVSDLGSVCCALLRDPASEVRCEAVKIIRNAGLAIGEDLLEALLNDEHGEICNAAMDIVGSRKISSLRHFLEEALESPDMWRASHAIEALGRFRDDSARDRLLSLLQKGTDFLRISALKTLGQWEDRELAAELEVYLDEDNPDVVRAAAEAMDRLRGETL
ncbi:MAG: HEAT repeat domain-containing protein [Desulfomonilia bacterium]|jgi:HEAT repeat protein